MQFRLILRAIAALALAPAFAFGQGVLEVPAPASYQSGIGLISGWHCNAQRIEVSIDGGPLFLAGSHTPRADTLQVCGRSDTGFSATFNWSILSMPSSGAGSHRIVAFADGIPFADATFNTTRFNTEYLTGRSGTYSLPNFPDLGVFVVVSWDQDKQNFTIAQTTSNGLTPSDARAGSGTYYGAMNRAVPFLKPDFCRDPSPPNLAVPGTFVVDTSNGNITMRAQFSDGSVCELPPVPFARGGDGFVYGRYDATAAAACPAFPAGLNLSVNGTRLNAVSLEQCSTGRMTGAIFSFF